MREICAAVGLKSTATVSYHLGELKRQGRIQTESGKSRTISVAPAVRSGTIPIVGLVTAGQPILAQENWEGTLPWDGEPDCFALRVRGDSMVGAGIFSGESGNRAGHCHACCDNCAHCYSVNFSSHFLQD